MSGEERPLEIQPDLELMMRKKLLDAVLKMMRNDPFFTRDARTPRMTKVYEAQAAAVNGEIQRRILEKRGGVKPESVKVGLKPADLSGEALS